MAEGFGDLSVLRTGLVSSPAPNQTESILLANPGIDEVLHFLRSREPRLRFGKMFPDLEEFRPTQKSLVELGQAMNASADVCDNPLLSAGFTYLGQFIDHDTTFDLTETPPIDNVPVDRIKQGRTPSLDLDSLYGGEVDKARDPKLYEADGVHLRLGSTKPDSAFPVWKSFPNDLPRTAVDNQTALVGDPRNDENLAVAQTALAFIKFHNSVVDILKKDYSGEELFKEARRKVVKHYQWIVLHDFLPGLLQRDVLEAVINEGCKHFLPNPGEEPFMPLEFSRAAFRIGHSQVRSEYEWNRFFQSGNRATLIQLLRFTGFRGGDLFGNDRLPSTWIVDWTRFFDFAEYPGLGKNPLLNFTKRIDTSLAKEFSNLPLPPNWPPVMRSLSVIDLLRGSEVGLPAAQMIANRLKESALKPGSIRVLTPDEVAARHPEIVRHYNFDKLTPLWYYVLREAEVLWQGMRLGPVGSYIIAETFVGLIKASVISILRKEQLEDIHWLPDLGPVKSERFNMADMLYFVNDLNPVAEL
jgi:hypothetical protein